MNKQDKKWLNSLIPILENIAYNIKRINPNINYKSEAYYLENLVKQIKEKTFENLNKESENYDLDGNDKEAYLSKEV